MEQTGSIIRYIVIFIITASLLGLGGWYFFLRQATSGTEAIDSSRGFGSQSPSFNGAVGSTYQNMITDATGVSAPTTQMSGQQSQKPPELWHVTQNPVAGAGFVVNQMGATKLYFAERATGYIFLADTGTGALVRLSNTLRPKIYEALFSNDGSVVERSLDDGGHIATFVGKLSANIEDTSTTSQQVLTGILLDPDVLALAVDPNSNQFLYTVAQKGSLVGIKAPWSGKKATNVFTSPLFQWRIQWLPDGRIMLAQNSADDVPGSSFQLANDGSFKPLIVNAPGLTILPKSGSAALLYGVSSNGSLSLYAQVDGASAAVKLPIKTIADKCVWAPGKSLIAYCAVPQTPTEGTPLNDLHTGVLHTADSWWRINVKDATAQLMYAPSEGSVLDVEHPQIDLSGKLISFINGTDMSLWLLRMDASSTPAR